MWRLAVVQLWGWVVVRVVVAGSGGRRAAVSDSVVTGDRSVGAATDVAPGLAPYLLAAAELDTSSTLHRHRRHHA